LGKHISENALEGVILVPGPNLCYYTGVKSLLLERLFLFFVPRDGDPHLVAPTFEAGPYQRLPFNIVVHQWDDGVGPSPALHKLVNGLDLKGKWGVEGGVPYRFIHLLLNHARPELEDAEPILQGIREKKEAKEIGLLQKAATILSRSFQRFPDIMKAGMTELELARKLSEVIYSNGAELVGDMLVQSGALAADPHHLASRRKLKRRESIVIDAACTYSGYYADITRTFMIGHDRKFEGYYQKLLEAQENAIAQSRAGATVGSVDEAARSHLRNHGLDEFFIHRTGHGLGLEVHEAPYIIPAGSEVLQPSMVFTIEPGVYLPGKLGIRIEDNIAAAEHGARVLTRRLPKEFGWWR